MITYTEAIRIACEETGYNKVDILRILESDTDSIFSFDKYDMPITLFVDKNDKTIRYLTMRNRQHERMNNLQNLDID